MLTAVDIKIMVKGVVTTPLLFDIRETIDGFPILDNNETLAAISIPPASIMETGWISIDLRDFNIEVERGDVLAIVLRSDADPARGDSDPWYAWSTSGWSDYYTSGIACKRYDWSGDVWLEGHDRPDIEEDRNFRTYVGMGR